PTQALAAGKAHDVPLIIGWNSGEDSLLGGPGGGQRFAQAMAPIARNFYAAEAEEGEEALGRAAFTDQVFAAPARWIARQAAGGAGAYLYHFSYVGHRFRPVLARAHHAAEIQYVFEYWGRRTPMSQVSAEDQAMARLMHGCWVGFARTGRPACEGLDWPAYEPAGGALLESGPESGGRAGFRRPQLDAWEAIMLPRLALD
ncbi:MAG TPA: carboxylesterase family protein, partial [Phenylobacterium sp.]|nr:carboxylesterase family protein [Phenylobacterium sp.]